MVRSACNHINPGLVSVARSIRRLLLVVILGIVVETDLVYAQLDSSRGSADHATIAKLVEETFSKDASPFLSKYCTECHNESDRESGVRVDDLDGLLADKTLILWESVLRQVAEREMPPEDSPQPSADERIRFQAWLARALDSARSRNVARNGSVRRLTVDQYRNTLRELLMLEENLTEILPPDGVSKDGFTNNTNTLMMSPLQLEAYFQIAEKALRLSVVDEAKPPTIQHFRMELGQGINSDPCPDNLILGANNLLLANTDFVVTEPTLQKLFPFVPFAMQRQFKFIEGYQGNDTVRGWKDFNSIYHAVFACMRGSEGYPKGLAYESVPRGLLLRPAIPSREIFGESNTYGPHANFKISLRELPEQGRFRVKVRAAKEVDGLLLDRRILAATQGNASGAPNKDSELSNMAMLETAPTHSIQSDFQSPASIVITDGGIYQLDLYPKGMSKLSVTPDASRLEEDWIGNWDFEASPNGRGPGKEFVGKLVGGAKLVDSPFGKSLSVDGNDGAVVIPRDERMNVGEGDFTVTAWINPHELRQGGIVCLGEYNYTHGWYFDMPDNRGILRIETMNSDRKLNGVVQSAPGILRTHRWQHVAAVVKRGENQTKLYVNGYHVATGTIQSANLDNPTKDMHIGRIQGAQKFLGEIDDVRLFRRALSESELEAIIEPGRQFATAPFPEGSQQARLSVSHPGNVEKRLSGHWTPGPFAVIRLDRGPAEVSAKVSGNSPIDRIELRRVEELSPLGQSYLAFESRSPKLGVHVGLRRDCGSTLAPVGEPQVVANTELQDFIFEGAIQNFPSPDVEKDNVNYLAGIREIGVRSEYTDDRDMPRLLIRSVEFEGPYYDAWPPAPHRNIFIPTEHPRDWEWYSREIITSFASRAYRRPASDDEIAYLMKLWRRDFEGRDEKNTVGFRESVLGTLAVVLTSPQFLFLIEQSATPESEPIEPWELASKLSYFLWNSPPDDELLKLAASGTLVEQLDRQIDRMIDDPKFKRFAEPFASQWFSLDKLDAVETDAKRFPRLTKEVKHELRKEPARFLEYLVRNNLSVSNLVASDFVLANEVVAQYYGWPERTESGFDFVPVVHGDPQRGGVLTQAGILAGLSDGREPNPVKRGAWFARKIIAEPPEDPPPNVPKLEDLTQLTLRQRLEKHRSIDGCIKCHTGIDPWGLPFEQFDASGIAKGKSNDSSADLPDGKHVADFNELRAYLLADRMDQIAFSALKHISVYAIGRSLTYNETRQLKDQALELKNDGYRMRDMIRFVVLSDWFTKK